LLLFLLGPGKIILLQKPEAAHFAKS